MDTVSARPASRAYRIPVAILTLVLALGALFPLTASAGEPVPFPLPITKFDCEADPGVIPQAVIPDGCVLVEGVSMAVTDTEGTELGSCVTDANGTCTVDVDVPDNATVLVEEDEELAVGDADAKVTGFGDTGVGLADAADTRTQLQVAELARLNPWHGLCIKR